MGELPCGIAAVIGNHADGTAWRLAEFDVQHDGRVRGAAEREREDVSGLSAEQILHRGRQKSQLATDRDR